MEGWHQLKKGGIKASSTYVSGKTRILYAGMKMIDLFCSAAVFACFFLCEVAQIRISREAGGKGSRMMVF